MSQRGAGCGAHPLGEANPGSYFDYTCDDCMLPWNHYDPPEQNDISNNEETNEASSKSTEDPPF